MTAAVSAYATIEVSHRSLLKSSRTINLSISKAFSRRKTLALSPERQSARMSKIKNGGLDQYGAEPFEQQQFGTAGVEGVNKFPER